MGQEFGGGLSWVSAGWLALDGPISQMASSLRYLCPGGSMVSLSPHGFILQGLSTCLGILIVCWTQGSSIKKKNFFFYIAVYLIRTSLVAQLVKSLPAMQETRVWSLGWEDPLEKGMATHSSILAWNIPMDRGAWQATVHGVAQSQTRLSAHAHTWLMVLWQFQVDSKGTQPYTCMYQFSPKLSSYPGCHIALSRVPCAVQ